MAIAVSVLMFLIGIVWLVLAVYHGFDLPSFLISAATFALGVLNIAWPHLGIRIATGVELCLQALAALGLFIYVLKEMGSRNGPQVILAFLSFLLFAWVTTFAVLQLTIVV